MSPASFRELRIFEGLYQAILDHRLTFLICEAEPTISLGDILKLREWSNDLCEHTGRTCYVQATFIMADPLMGIRVGFVAVQIKIKILTDRLKSPGSVK